MFVIEFALTMMGSWLPGRMMALPELTIVKVRYNDVLDRPLAQIPLTLIHSGLGVLARRPFVLLNCKQLVINNL